MYVTRKKQKNFSVVEESVSEYKKLSNKNGSRILVIKGLPRKEPNQSIRKSVNL